MVIQLHCDNGCGKVSDMYEAKRGDLAMIIPPGWHRRPGIMLGSGTGPAATNRVDTTFVVCSDKCARELDVRQATNGEFSWTVGNAPH